MPVITKECIDEISSRTDIVALISEYVHLEQRGSSWWACCPFHSEKTPSFNVSPDKKFYHCFGCGASGDAFTFVKEMEKVSFTEAAERLAKRAGVEIRYEQGAVVKDDSSLRLKSEYKALYTRVANMFHYALMVLDTGKFAKDYIMERGVSAGTLEKFKIGYSPSDRRWLREFLTKKNYAKDFLDASGLFSKSYPDLAFFHDRLMFPIFDKDGDVVAFGGRFLRGDEKTSPKYINSGDMIHFKKGSVLYAFNFAKKAIREQKRVIFCEGYMDCIAYHQCGITWAVAPLGTSLTEEQIGVVKNFVQEIYLSFDSDEAGQKATKRAILMCRRQNIAVKVITLTGGKDPAEIMLKFGSSYLTNEVNNAILDCNYLLLKLQQVYPKDTPTGKTGASLEFFDYLDSLQSDVFKDACLDLLCQTYGIQKVNAENDYFNRKRLLNTFRTSNTSNEVNYKKDSPSTELRALMTFCGLESSAGFEALLENIDKEEFRDPKTKELFSVMKECLNNGNFSTTSILNRIDDDDFRKLIIQYISENKGNLNDSVEGCINYLKRCSLEAQKQELSERISNLSKSSIPEDQDTLKDLIKQKMLLDTRSQELKSF